MNTGDYRGQKMVLGPLELKLQLFMSRLVWILGPKLSPLKEEQVLLTGAISPAPYTLKYSCVFTNCLRMSSIYVVCRTVSLL